MTTVPTEREAASEVTLNLHKRTIDAWVGRNHLVVNLDHQVDPDLVALLPAILRELTTE